MTRNHITIIWLLFLYLIYRFIFSLPLIFTLQAANISHFLTATMKFSCFSSNEIHLLCFQSLTLALSVSVIHMSVNIKNNMTWLCCFFSLKVRTAVWFPSKQNLELHLGFHTCWLSYFTLVCLWCWQTGQCNVTQLPKFLRWVDYHIFLPMVLCCTRFAHARASL